MYSFAKHAVINFVASLSSAAASDEKPTTETLHRSDLLVAFLADIGPAIVNYREQYRQALAQIATDKEQGAVKIPGGALYPVHKASRDARTEAQHALTVLVPAQRMARRLVQQLRFQPGCADMPALEDHLLSHAYQTPRALLFSDNTVITRKQRCNDLAHRHTHLTLTQAQAALARELLARHTELFPWGPKFAAGRFDI